jgi:hypothetical protein
MLLVWKKSDIYDDSWVLVLDEAPGSVIFATVVSISEGALLSFPFLKNDSVVCVGSVIEGKAKAEACLKNTNNMVIYGVLSKV